MGWKTFNDRLAIVLLAVMLALWLTQALTKITLPSDVNGALIVTFTLVVQYYFRKAPAAATSPPTGEVPPELPPSPAKPPAGAP